MWRGSGGWSAALTYTCGQEVVTVRADGDGRGVGEECGLQKMAARW
jgi:hypothetical protein